MTSISATSLHESGHAIAAALKGFSIGVVYVNVEYERRFEQQHYARFGYSSDRPLAFVSLREDRNKHIPLKKMLPVLVAGSVAMQLGKYRNAANLTELQVVEIAGDAAELLARKENGTRDDMTQYIGTLASVAGVASAKSKGFLPQMLFASCEDATRMLAPRWSAVQALAAILEEKHVADSNDVMGVIAAADPTWLAGCTGHAMERVGRCSAVRSNGERLARSPRVALNYRG